LAAARTAGLLDGRVINEFKPARSDGMSRTVHALMKFIEKFVAQIPSRGANTNNGKDL